MAPTAAEKQLEAISTVQPGAADQARLALQGFTVLVRAPPETDKDSLTRAHLLLNLLPRVFQHVHYDGPDQALDLPDSHKAKIRRDAPAKPNLVVNLGQTPRTEPCRTLYATSRGWTSYLSTERPWDEPQGAQNGIATAFCAALVVQDAFHQAVHGFLERGHVLNGTHLYDVANLRTTTRANYEPDVSKFHTENALLVGTGAVGQAFLAALSALPNVTGEIRILDHDLSDEGNEQRCLFAFPESRDQPKVLLAQQYCKKAHPHLRVDIPFAGVNLVTDYSAYRLISGARRPEELVVTALDQEQPRRDVQAGLHKVILNGWTETNRNMLSYGLGWHRIGADTGCLSCFHTPLLAPPSEEEFAANRTGLPVAECRRRLQDPTILNTQAEVAEVAKRLKLPIERLAPATGRPFVDLIHGVCGVAGMEVQGEPVVASVTHVPALTGFLLAAQFVLHTLGARTVPHLAFFTAFHLPADEHEDRRPPNPACYCQIPAVQQAYRTEWQVEGTKSPRPAVQTMVP